jgi:hypothetical protein
LNSDDLPVRPLALAGLTALLVTLVARADEPKTRSAASAETAMPDNQSWRLEGPTAKQYAQFLAEFAAEQAVYLQAATKAEGSRDKRAIADKRPRDSVVYYITLAGWWTWPRRPPQTRQPATLCFG